MTSTRAALLQRWRCWLTISAMLLPVSATAGDFETVVRPILARYCLACHNANTRTAGLDLASAAGVKQNPALWTKLADGVESGAMPPVGPRPSAAERSALIEVVRNVRESARSTAAQPAFQRLTNVEYVNSVRDLLGIRIDPSRFLPEDSEGTSGFINDSTGQDASANI